MTRSKRGRGEEGRKERPQARGPEGAERAEPPKAAVGEPKPSPAPVARPAAPRRARLALSAALVAVAGAVTGAAIAAAAITWQAGSAPVPAEEPAAIEASAAQQAQDAPACDHQWRTLGLYEQTEAATHEEEVPAVVETVEEPHTVCNTCYAVVDGATAEHTAATGHAGFTTDVPVPVEVVVQEGGVREVVDEPAEQRFTPILEWCPACGATQPAGQLEQAAQAAGEG